VTLFSWGAGVAVAKKLTERLSAASRSIGIMSAPRAPATRLTCAANRAPA
jgi:hypothetical protein